MVIVPKYHCRLGNNISQYVWPRLVAESLGFAFSAPQIPGLNVATAVAGAEHAVPTEHVSDFNDVPVDAQSILGNRMPRRLVMEGHFQQGTKYERHRERITRWLSNSLRPCSSTAGCIVAHVRLGDYCGLGWALPPAYYQWCASAVRTMCHARCFVVADDTGAALSPYLSALGALNPSVVCGGSALEDFERLAGARCVIASNSTYAWWAAFVGQAEHVWLPHNWQPWGISQIGDRHFSAGRVYPSDMRAALAGWHVVDMTGGVPR